jgi:hypothetical protein
MSLQPPFLSVFDPPESGEGSIDPLSLMATYENLAERIYPYITVRMARPRFLTAMVVGAHVCGEFIDELAADEVTPAWLVFEWYVVEAFIRCMQDYPEGQMSRIPGTRKVQNAQKDGRRVSAATYLKTPQVFGFSGVYRRLARGLRILSDDLAIDEGGFKLISAWEKGQGLKGFYAEQKGTGAEFREELRRAVREGMRRGHVVRKGKAWWETLARHLRPGGARKGEAECIAQQLFSADLRPAANDPMAEHMRCEMLEHIQEHGKPVGRDEEPGFFRKVMRKASPELRDRLEYIDAYEGVGRIVDDALRFILYLSTEKGAVPVTEKDFSETNLSRQLTKELPAAIDRLEQCAPGMEGMEAVTRLLVRYSGIHTSQALFQSVIAHHEEAQQHKPPDGKRPWLDRIGAGVVVRALYSNSRPPVGGDRYVFPYRTSSVCSFLVDLKRLQP